VTVITNGLDRLILSSGQNSSLSSYPAQSDSG